MWVAGVNGVRIRALINGHVGHHVIGVRPAYSASVRGADVGIVGDAVAQLHHGQRVPVPRVSLLWNHRLGVAVGVVGYRISQNVQLRRLNAQAGLQTEATEFDGVHGVTSRDSFG